MKTWGELVRALHDGDLKDSVKYTLVAGLLAHGTTLFNKLSWHDDLNHGFILPQTRAVTMGRWLRAALGYAVSKAFGGKNLSLPLFFGVVSILLIALSAHVILCTFDIRRKPLRIALCGLMVAFPVVTGTFGYMFTAPYYFLSLLLAALGAYVAKKRGGWDGFAVASVCICAAVGIYQAYFPVAVSLIVIGLIFEIADGEFETFGRAFVKGLYYFGVCAVSMALYYGIWHLTMKVMGLRPINYQGISDIGKSGVSAYLRAVREAYQYFFLRNDRPTTYMYPWKMLWVQWLITIASCLGGLYIVLRHIRRDKWQAVLMALLMALLPLCFNLIYVLTATSPSENVRIYTLMLYGQCMLYVFLICVLDSIWDSRKRLAKPCSRIIAAAMLLLLCMDVYYDNACYLKAEMMIQQTISDMTVMISRIKSLEGYKDTMPVCFVRTGHRDATQTSNPWFDDLFILPFGSLNPYHNSRNIADYLEKWCGFAPKIVNESKFMKKDEVKQMPDYPDAGSVRIIDDTVVVKW